MKILLFISLFLLTCNSDAQNIYFPPSNNNTWDTLSYVKLNYCADRIDSLYKYLADQKTKSFILLKDGKIVLEKYFGTYSKDSIWPWYSAGKSLTASLIGIAQENGFLDIHKKVSDYIGKGWTSEPQAKEDLITVWNQLTMTSGLNELAFYCITPNCLLYKADAGTRWAYHNGPYNLTKDVLEATTSQSINVFTTLRIKNKIGMQSGVWIPSGTNHYFFSSARDMARYGILMQSKMVWANNTMVLKDTAYYRQMISTSQLMNPSYGLLWWLNGKSSHITPESPQSISGPIAPHAPADVFVAGGAMGQFISVSPGTGLIMIRQGLSATDDLAALDMHDQIWEKIMKLNCVTTASRSIQWENSKIYPNPTHSFIHVDRQSNENFRISIADIAGHKVKEFINPREVNMSDLCKGVYFVSVINKNNQIETVEKIVLQ
jgi:CubicO group peptidase (beta-lactamase class C family)